MAQMQRCNLFLKTPVHKTTSGAQLQDPDPDHLNHHQNMHPQLLPLEMMIRLMARPTLTVTK
jgi:hypothetical protein